MTDEKCNQCGEYSIVVNISPSKQYITIHCSDCGYSWEYKLAFQGNYTLVKPTFQKE